MGGRVTLGGRLEVSLLDSFAPDLGEQFTLLITTNLSGAFSQLSAPQGISITYTNTGVVPVVTGIVPTQILGPALTNGAAVFSFGTVSNRSYTVEWTPASSPATWQVWTNLTGSGGKASVSVSLTGAARRFFRVSQP